MAYKLYVNGKLFQSIINSVVYNKGQITIGGVKYDYNN